MRSAAASSYAEAVLLWFVVTAPILVAEVFRSPMIDYRMVAIGALLPVAEVVVGRVFVLHTLAAPVALLVVVMAATTGRRLLRRRLLGVPIGLFLHLVLDGAFTSPDLFWWPLFGLSFAELTVPEADGIGWRLLLEVLAIGLGAMAWRRYGLDDPAARSRLLRTGHLPATVRAIGGR